jgi:Flp pilus assembly pilin Flp
MSRAQELPQELPMTRVRLACNPRGQGLAEYALVLALIAIVAASALLFLSGGVDSGLSKIGAQL